MRKFRHCAITARTTASYGPNSGCSMAARRAEPPTTKRPLGEATPLSHLSPRRCCFPILAVKETNLERREIDVIQAANVDRPTLRRESRPVKRMDPAVSTEVVRRSPGVELVGGQRVLTRGDFELFYLCLLVERSFALTHRAVTLRNRLDFGLNLERDAPAMAGPSVCRHNFLPTSDVQLTCRVRLREAVRRAKPE